jgi:Putative peptidoglycan binding domain
MIDVQHLIDTVAEPLFGGGISAEQTGGITAICAEWDGRGLTDTRWLADMLGQSYEETDKTMMPVREAYWMSEDWRRDNLRYYPYYGRGHIQDTWEDNYAKMNKILLPRFPGLDLVANPDEALRMDVSVASMFEGMLRGMFTGAKLSDYFNDRVEDFFNSRRIVNGTDNATKIASFCQTFYSGLGGPAHVRLLVLGDTGDDVKLVQGALAAQGFYATVDGEFGKLTRQAIFDFQRAKKIGVDGEVGPETRSALGIQP